MNKALFNKVLPHVIAVIIFLVIAVIYCKPALQGMVLSQHDITQFQGAVQGAEEYREKHGSYPLWTNNMFSGMPMFQIGGHTGNTVAAYTHLLLTLGLPEPIQFFFLACITFYFLCMVMRMPPWLGVLGALAFAYATYNPVIIAAGHNTKMWSIAYMPALLGSIMLLFDRKYLIGGVLTGLFTSVMVAMNHLQIVYYLLLVVAIMSIFFVVRSVKKGETKHMLTALGIALFMGAVGLLSNALGLFSTYDYQKRTIRGGPSELTDSTQLASSRTGLDKDYAFSYSMTITEPFVMMIPRMFGGSSGGQDIDPEESKAIEAIRALPPQLQQQMPLSWYWGGMSKPGESTSGPPYLGAIICFLAIVALFVADNRYKWWMAAASALAIVLSWGSYFDGFNSLLYHYLPFYNKFRAPSMALVIPQLLLPALAVLGVQSIVNYEDKQLLWAKFKKSLIATAGVFALLFVIYFSVDFRSEIDRLILRQMSAANDPQLYEGVRSFFDGLKEDRQALMRNDIFRAIGFILVAAFVLFLLIKKSIKPLAATIALTVFSFIDLMTINTNYLNNESYQEKEENTLSFQKTQADQAILADTSYFRVFNVGGNAFQEAITSYYYNSLGGYHAAKLRIYQDLIDRQLLGRRNFNVVSMLNAKYLISKDQYGRTQQYQLNPDASGPCWFVKDVQIVKTADEEMSALDSLDFRNTAVIREDRKHLLPAQFGSDSAAQIRLVKNDYDVIEYTSSSSSDQLAVFSEIYYDAGWKAFINDKEVPIIRVNYALRGLHVPAGNHTIIFRFEPAAYLTGKLITTISSMLLLVLLVAVAGYTWWKGRRPVPQNQS